MSEIQAAEMDDIHDPDFKPTVDLKEMNLPPIMMGRIKALKNLQMKAVKVEADYYKQVGLLDAKYQAKYEKHYQQMAKVICGDHEPSGAELEWFSDVEEEDVAKDEDVKDEKAVPTRKTTTVFHPDFPADAKGLPKFWLHALKNANEECLLGLIEPRDEPVLEYMTDLTVSLYPDNLGFTLTFYFALNPYITNKYLTKEYFLRDGPDPKCPMQYDGPEIVSCTGSTVNWKTGMDVTMETTEVGDVKKLSKTGSFFTFFSPPSVKEDCNDAEEVEKKKTLAVDYEIGFAIKEKIIPRAIVYFTGEIFRDDDEGVEDEDKDEEEEKQA